MGRFLKYIYLLLTVFTYLYGLLVYKQLEYATAAGSAILCASFFLLFIRRIKKDGYYYTKLSKIDKMSGIEFEQYLSVQFRRKGYRVHLTERSHDYGADLVLKKKRKKIIVQAKRYDKNVGIAAVQEIVGAIAYYDADEAMVVTNQHYTRSAKKLAEQNNVILWTREDLVEKFGAR